MAGVFIEWWCWDLLTCSWVSLLLSICWAAMDIVSDISSDILSREVLIVQFDWMINFTVDKVTCKSYWEKSNNIFLITLILTCTCKGKT